MNNLSNALTVAWKELQLLSKDRGALVVYFLMPLLFASFFGQMGMMASASGENAPDVVVDLLLVNQDSGPYGERLEAILDGIDILTIQRVAQAEEADQAVAEGDATAAVIVPASFSQDIDGHTPTQVQVILDPIKQDAAGIVAGLMNQVVGELNMWGEVTYGIRVLMQEAGVLEGASSEQQRAAEAQTMGVIMTQLDQMRQRPPIAVRSEDVEGEETAEAWSPFTFNMPAFATMFAFFLIGAIAVGILQEKENGSFRRLLASPIRPGSIIAGKMLAFMIVVFLQAIVLFGAGRIFFGMSLGRSPLALALLTLLLAFAASSLGMLLATMARSSSQADSLGVIIPLVLAGLGGCIALGGLFFRAKGTVMYYISNLTPHAHALEGYLRLLGEGRGLADIMVQLAILGGMGVLFFLLAMWRFKFD